MQTVRYKFGGIVMLSFLLLAASGCRQQAHRHEQNEIHNKRRQEEKATSDLNDAVKATDEIGWEAGVMYKKFSDKVRPHLAYNKHALTDFKIEASQSQGKVPLRYRRRIRKMEQRNAALEKRLDRCTIKYKPEWDDFTTLYLSDLQQLEGDIQKLTGNLK